MFNTIIDSKLLKDVVDALAPVVDETKIHITPEGINIRAVDPPQALMVAVDLKKGAFEKFEATDMDIAVDIRKISERLAKFDSDTKINLFVDENKRALVLDGGGVKFSMRLVDPASVIRKEPNVPKLTFPVVVTMAGSELRKAVKTVATVADEIYFNVDNGQLCMYGVSNDKMDDAQYNITVLKIDATEPAKALYRADYIEDIAKTMAKADTMTVELKSDFPMRMSTVIANGNCNILYFIAPRTADV